MPLNVVGGLSVTVVWGNPYHGKVKNGEVEHDTGKFRPVSPDGQPIDGSTTLIGNPSKPDPTPRDSAQAALDAELGHQWRGRAVLAGREHQLHGFDLGEFNSIYVDPEGAAWLIETEVSFGARTFKVILKSRFGKFNLPGVAFGEEPDVERTLIDTTSFTDGSDIYTAVLGLHDAPFERLPWIEQNTDGSKFVINAWATAFSGSGVNFRAFPLIPDHEGGDSPLKKGLAWVYEITVSGTGGADGMGISASAALIKTQSDLWDDPNHPNGTNPLGFNGAEERYMCVDNTDPCQNCGAGGCTNFPQWRELSCTGNSITCDVCAAIGNQVDCENATGNNCSATGSFLRNNDGPPTIPVSGGSTPGVVCSIDPSRPLNPVGGQPSYSRPTERGLHFYYDADTLIEVREVIARTIDYTINSTLNGTGSSSYAETCDCDWDLPGNPDCRVFNPAVNCVGASHTTSWNVTADLLATEVYEKICELKFNGVVRETCQAKYERVVDFDYPNQAGSFSISPITGDCCTCPPPFTTEGTCVCPVPDDGPGSNWATYNPGDGIVALSRFVRDRIWFCGTQVGEYELSDTVNTQANSGILNPTRGSAWNPTPVGCPPECGTPGHPPQDEWGPCRINMNQLNYDNDILKCNVEAHANRVWTISGKAELQDSFGTLTGVTSKEANFNVIGRTDKVVTEPTTNFSSEDPYTGTVEHDESSEICFI